MPDPKQTGMFPFEPAYRGCYQEDHKGQPCQQLPEDPKVLARRNDPEESKKAAREIVPKLGKLQRQVLNLVKQYPDRTAGELLWDVCNFATAQTSDARWIGRRLPELASQGKVFKSGSRRCQITGKTAATWRAV